MADGCPFERVGQAGEIVDHVAERPEEIIGIADPIDLMRVEKQARARGGEKLVNLAADIAEIDIGAARIAHVEQAVGCEVDHDLAGHRQLRHRRALGIACFRSEEHTSELQSLMRISYAVFCLNKKKQNYT